MTVVQLRGVVERLIAASRWRQGDPEILVVLDAGYDAPRIAHPLANLPVRILGRMRSDRVLHRPTPPPVHNPLGGRFPKHGGEFVFGAPTTWGGEDVLTRTDTRLYGTATAQAWNRPHPRLTRRNAWIDHTAPLPIIEGTVIRLTVKHLPSGGVNKPVWLWCSDTEADATKVDRWWQMFLCRFDVEHTFRMLKQTLGWTRPRLRDPEAADRWTWLILAAHAQLRSARPLVADLRRPWERPAEPAKLTPPASGAGSGTSTQKSPVQRPHQNRSAPDPDDRPARRTGSPHRASTSDYSWPPARHTPDPPTTRRAPNPAEQVKRQAKGNHRSQQTCPVSASERPHRSNHRDTVEKECRRLVPEGPISTRREIIRVPGLRPGDLIRVTSPSLPSLAFARRSTADGVAALEQLGLRCDFSEHALDISDDGRSAGSAEVRTADLHAAFLDPEVAGVLCAVGGLTSADLLPLLDADLIRAHPKPLIGRSDNTYLNAFLFEKAGITSFTGAAFVTQFADQAVDPRTLDSFGQVVLGMGDGPVRLRTSTPRTENSRPSSWAGEVHHWAEAERAGRDVWLRPGHAAGRLVGGEIGIVASLIEAGMLTIQDGVFWLDVVDDGLDYFEEQLARLEPLVAGSDVRAALIADNPSVPFAVWLDTVDKALPRLARQVTGPVLVGGDLGHYQPSWLLPYGDLVEVDEASGVTVGGSWRSPR